MLSRVDMLILFCVIAAVTLNPQPQQVKKNAVFRQLRGEHLARRPRRAVLAPPEAVLYLQRVLLECRLALYGNFGVDLFD